MRRAIKELREEGYSIAEIISGALVPIAYFMACGAVGTIERTGEFNSASVTIGIISMAYMLTYTLIKIYRETA